MNTSKQVQVMVGLLFVSLVATLFYYLWDGVRAEDAQERQVVENAERGGALFATNCRVCHGLNGLGTLENSLLPGAALNDESKRPQGDPGTLQTLQQRFRDTIVCGRVGTLMPPWSTEQGGALNDFQIEQLVTLITGAQPGLDTPDDLNAVSAKGWEVALEEADHADILEGKKLAEAVGDDDTTWVLTDGKGFNPEALLRVDEEVVRIVDAPASGRLDKTIDAKETEFTVERASDLFARGDIVQAQDEKMRVVRVSGDDLTVERGVDGTEAKGHRGEVEIFEPGKEIEVERAVFNTEAAEHEEGTQLYIGPLEPPTEPLLGEGGEGTCGQLGVAGGGPAAAEPVAIESGATITMGDNFFEFDGQQNPSFSVTVGQEYQLTLENIGAVPHNMRIAGADNEYDNDDDFVSDPDVVTAGESATITFTLTAAGTFDYRCDFHPAQMTGTIVVSE